ncbi:MAG: hypothetical protein ACXVA0_23470 [Mucilaginibacter sp.]
MRRRRKSNSEGILDALLELTGLYWPVGAVVSSMLLFLSFIAYSWVNSKYLVALSSPNLVQLIKSYGWVIYSLPLIIAVLAFIFGLKTYDSYRNGRF